MNARQLWCCGVAAPLVVAAAFVSAHAVTGPPLLQNVTPSLPLGTYRRLPRPVAVGSIVAVDQPAVARPYLMSLGFPVEALVLKRVLAGPGAPICATGDNVEIDGRTLRRSRRDSRGVALPRWMGCRKLALDEVFLVGEGAQSFDSRYFGPIHRGDVAGVYGAIR